ncbi:hypothetical protein D3C72_511300 [compost metagenome]
MNPSDPPAERFALLTVLWRIVSTDLAGGDVSVIESGSTAGSTSGGGTGVSGVFSMTRGAFDSRAGSKTGNRRLTLQAMIGANGTSANLTNRRLSGFYAA